MKYAGSKLKKVKVKKTIGCCYTEFKKFYKPH